VPASPVTSRKTACPGAGWLEEGDREDLAQDVLLEMKQKLVGAHDCSRGRFRALLQAVVKRRVIDHLRKVRPTPLPEAAADSLAAPAEEEVEALDLETSLLDAVAACRDRFTQGRHKDPDVLYALVDRLVHGLSSAEIARRNGVSPDRIARLLRRGRDAVFHNLLSRELEIPEGDPRLKGAVTVWKRLLRTPRAAASLLEETPDTTVRERLEELLSRFQAALPHFRGDDSVRGRELARGIELVFEGLERGDPDG
jgi:DNA-directed RNA polymerase specialized sigma24 family protein